TDRPGRSVGRRGVGAAHPMEGRAPGVLPRGPPRRRARRGSLAAGDHPGGRWRPLLRPVHDTAGGHRNDEPGDDRAGGAGDDRGTRGPRAGAGGPSRGTARDRGRGIGDRSSGVACRIRVLVGGGPNRPPYGTRCQWSTNVPNAPLPVAVTRFPSNAICGSPCSGSCISTRIPVIVTGEAPLSPDKS